MENFLFNFFCYVKFISFFKNCKIKLFYNLQTYENNI